jgi:hypothetical protein
MLRIEDRGADFTILGGNEQLAEGAFPSSSLRKPLYASSGVRSRNSTCQAVIRKIAFVLFAGDALE